MTLTFTLGAGLIIEDEGHAGARELLIAVLGCNVAWGVIDGALYLVGQLFDRGRLQRLGHAISAHAPPQRSRHPGRRAELNPLLGGPLSPRETERSTSASSTTSHAKPRRRMQSHATTGSALRSVSSWS